MIKNLKFLIKYVKKEKEKAVEEALNVQENLLKKMTQ